MLLNLVTPHSSSSFSFKRVVFSFFACAIDIQQVAILISSRRNHLALSYREQCRELRLKSMSQISFVLECRKTWRVHRDLSESAAHQETRREWNVSKQTLNLH
jgi:hypothetical protein